VGYIALTHTLPWFHKKGVEMEYDEYAHMTKMVGFLYVNAGLCRVYNLSLGSVGG
jgi:hypothetical protein